MCKRKETVMVAQQTALIIGAGIGGIALAARLVRNGYDVTVLEKNATPAGAGHQHNPVE